MSGASHSDHYEEEFYVGEGNHFLQKLGGNRSDLLESARVASVAAAHSRMANSSTNSSGTSEVHEEPDPDDSDLHTDEEPTHMNIEVKEEFHVDSLNEVNSKPYQEPDPDDHPGYQNKFEPDPDDSQREETRTSEPFHSGFPGSRGLSVPMLNAETTQPPVTNSKLDAIRSNEEPDPDDLEASPQHCVVAEPETFLSEEMTIFDSKIQKQNNISEPDPDDVEAKRDNLEHRNVMKLDDDNSLINGTIKDHSNLSKNYIKADVGESQENGIVHAEPDPDDNLEHRVEVSRMQIDEPDPDDEELQRIQDPVAALCGRLQRAIELLRAEVDLAQATVVFQTLCKIIR